MFAQRSKNFRNAYFCRKRSLENNKFYPPINSIDILDIPMSPWAIYGDLNEGGVVFFHFFELLSCPLSGPEQFQEMSQGDKKKGRGGCAPRA